MAYIPPEMVEKLRGIDLLTYLHLQRRFPHMSVNNSLLVA